MDKKIKEAIWNIMNEESNLEQDFVIELLKQYAPKLETQSLIEKEYKKMANQLISSFKDDKGIRDVFVINNDFDLTAYVNVSRTKVVDDLKKVKNRLRKNVEGNQKSLLKVESRLYLLENQMTISEVAVTTNAKIN